MVQYNKYLLPATNGLVVCGGRSSRMGVDKSLLQYYEKSQRYHVYEMLQSFCEKVFISCNEAQVNTIEDGYASLTDDPAYKNIGPMAALLSAFTLFSKKNILFVGCDYPFLTTTDLLQFSTHCKDVAVSFYNEESDIYEPLLAWYPYQVFGELKKMYESGEYSLQQFLRKSGAARFYPLNKDCMISIDNKEDFTRAHSLINPSYLKNFF